MAFQKSVGLYNVEATQGDRASQNVTIYFPTNFLAGGTVKVGGFVWRDSTNGEREVVASGSGRPLGFVERIIDNPMINITTEGTLDIAEGNNVSVAIRGDFYVKADASVSVGDPVYAEVATGAVTFTADGANTVETGYIAVTSGASGDMVIITNMFQTVAENISGVLGYKNGGTGLSALGTAGQVLKTNAGATAIEWGTDAT